MENISKVLRVLDSLHLKGKKEISKEQRKNYSLAVIYSIMEKSGNALKICDFKFKWKKIQKKISKSIFLRYHELFIIRYNYILRNIYNIYTAWTNLTVS